MKKIILQSAKKLSKKELKTIAGGKLDCMRSNPCMEPCEQIPPGTCTRISVNCAQKECRPQIIDISIQ
ncbi:bacteriocin-type signal sequence-containing protein [Chryseobacterium oleae]|uniref:Bacteriocin-type signal sequence-containing protein n=1 Tax=Chryseobacterium oleae TaxID=491207 RepID=A0A1I4VG71_CHROL|nr:bacteriocin [Chryseobacterium oleae]SFN00130.1 bacteriocin-type signal sequence-containing protein [Chryseobacterium oleae]